MITHVEVNMMVPLKDCVIEISSLTVQFHPDATPGPHDEDSLFDDFMSMIDQRKGKKSVIPKRKDIHKIMVIGFWSIIIGQAAEFDYSGTQALSCSSRRRLSSGVS